MNDINLPSHGPRAVGPALWAPRCGPRARDALPAICVVKGARTTSYAGHVLRFILFK